MSATAVLRNTPMLGLLALMGSLSIGVKASEAIPAGAMVAIDTSGRLVNVTASSTLRVVGRNEKDVTGSLVDLAVLAEVRIGTFQWANSSSGDAIAADDIGKPCYAVDNQTVALTDAAGTRPFAGIIVAVDASGVYVAMTGFLDSAQAAKNEAGGAGAPMVQKGTGTLVAGVLTVNAGVQITAGSSIIVTRRTPGGTFSDGGFDCPNADRVVGEPGTGAFVIRARAQDGTANTADTSTVDYVIVG